MSQPTRSAMALPFRPVDIEAQSRAYKLEQRGAEDGSRNHPRTEETLAAQSEQTIIGAIEAERDRCLGDLSSNLRAERGALAQLQTAMDVAAMRQGADEAKAHFEGLKVRAASSLRECRQTAFSRVAEYDDFRRRNALVRVARQPSNRTFVWTLMGFIIVLEGIFNGLFFASGSDLGLLGGAMIAAAFSAVNVAVGVLNGWFPLRWMHHRNPALKALGFITFLAFGSTSILLNGFIAHFRDVSQASPDAEPLLATYGAILRNPIGLQSIESWLLLAVGIAFAAFAVAKGYALDDPYPSYGAVDRRRVIAQSAYEAVRQLVMSSADDFKDDFTEELRVKIETLRGSSSQRQQILAARARNLTDFGSHESHLANAAQQLLSIYRRANEKARSSPNPAHFGTVFAFRDHALERPAIRALREDQGLEIDAERLIRELDTLRQDVLAEYKALIRDKWNEECL